MKRHTVRGFLLILAVGLAVPLGVLAQTHEIPAHVVGGGGGTATSTSYSLSGTVGQGAAAIGLSSTSYQHDAGFWPMAQALTQGLGGVLVIGPDTGDDYATFGEAVADLIASGVSEAVIFQVKEGTYNEQISIPLISGVSADNTITFEPHPNNVTPVNLAHTALGTGDNFVVKLDGAQYVTFQGLEFTAGTSSYSRVFDLLHDVAHIKILHSTLNGVTGGGATNQTVIAMGASSGRIPDDIVIKGNAINNGSYGIWASGVTGEQMTNVEIDSNTVTNHLEQGIYVAYADAPSITRNTVKPTTSATADYWGIYVLWSINQTVIMSNQVDAINGGGGIQIDRTGGLVGAWALLANNVIHSGGGDVWSQGIKIHSLQQPYSYWEVYHNTAHVTGTSPTSGIAFWHNGAPDNTCLNLKHNIFANSGGGYAIRYYDVLDISSADRNDIFSTRADLIAVSGTNYTLTDFQSIFGHEINSLPDEPRFTGPAPDGWDYQLMASSPLIGWGDGGIVTPPWDVDVMGKARPTPGGTGPDLGAYEHDLGTPDQTAPAAPTGLTAQSGDGQVDLSWTPNTDQDLWYYKVYRDTDFDPAGNQWIADVFPPSNTYLDNDPNLANDGTPYWYWISALDSAGNESALSTSAVGAPEPPQAAANTASGYFYGDGRMRVLDAYPVDPAVADPSFYQITGNQMTLEAWIYPTMLPEPGDTALIVGRPAGGPESWENLYVYRLQLVNDGVSKVEFTVTDGGATVGKIATEAGIAPGSWAHVAGVYNGGNLAIYINGILEGTSPTYTSPVGAGYAGFYIGGLASHYFRGLIDEVRLWNDPRTGTEIGDNMNTGLIGDEEGLVGYWPLNDSTTIAGVSGVTRDLSAGNNHLQVQWDAEFFASMPFGEQVAPSLAWADIFYTVAGQPFVYAPVVGGGPGTSVTLISGPAGLVYDSGTNTVNWTASGDQLGYQKFTLEANNTTGPPVQEEYSIWVEQTPVAYKDHNNNQVSFSVFNNGVLGTYDEENLGGGFSHNGRYALYEGDLVIGIASNQVSGGLWARDFATRSGVDGHTSHLKNFDQAYISVYDDARALDVDGNPNPISVQIIQRSHSKPDAPDDDYVIMDYTIRNISGGPLTGLYAGLAMDWDLGENAKV
ncbi:MAG: right-handed parallel beta-helix repeat-containing protein, partial [Fidelibacterota bacterium]